MGGKGSISPDDVMMPLLLVWWLMACFARKKWSLDSSSSLSLAFMMIMMIIPSGF